MQFATSSVSANFFSQWMTARNKTEKKNKSVICSTTLLFATSPKTRLYARCTVYSFANTCYYYFFLSDDSYIVMVNVRILLQTIISNLKKKKGGKEHVCKKAEERERERKVIGRLTRALQSPASNFLSRGQLETWTQNLYTSFLSLYVTLTHTHTHRDANHERA